MILQDAVIWKCETLEDFIEEAVSDVGEALVEALAIVPMTAMAKTQYPSLRNLPQQKPKWGKPGNFHTMFYADSPDFSILYHNFSDVDWDLSDSTYNADFLQRAISTPCPTLKGNAAAEILALSVTADNIALGKLSPLATRVRLHCLTGLGLELELWYHLNSFTRGTHYIKNLDTTANLISTVHPKHQLT